MANILRLWDQVFFVTADIYNLRSQYVYVS